MNRIGGIVVSIGLAAGFACAERTAPAVFHVDSKSGNDSAEGTSPEAAWLTLDKVNAAELIPGDKVLFKRGGLWRGQLLPKSGNESARILYGAYGDGAKPILQGSAARDQAGEWNEVRPGLWATQKFEPKLLDQSEDLRGAAWSKHNEGGADVRLERMQEEGSVFTRITCEAAGKASNHIQLWGPTVTRLAPCLALRLRVRSTIPFTLESVRAIRNTAPYTTALAGHTRINIGTAWQTIDVALMLQQAVEAPRLHINLGDILPAGAVFDFETFGLWEASVAHCTPIHLDVGILILNHGEKWGVKKWSLEEVKAPLDYWYDPEGKRLYLASAANPATAFSSVELALTRHIVNQGGKHDITYDGLAIRYGAAHGFGGGSTHHITIRNCDLGYIGGGDQMGGDQTVRFGNGIEFWGAAHDCLVENCRLWQIYDAALTNQNLGSVAEEANITYRNNVIWDSEYSFEYWNNPAESVTRNIVFEHNTCVRAGYGWSHAQRPDPSGRHLCFYTSAAAQSEIVIRDNIFSQAREHAFSAQWWKRTQLPSLIMDHNLWFQPEGEVIAYDDARYTMAQFAAYQTELGLDANSLAAEPKLRDAAALDFRLAPGSPGIGAASDGSDIGASGRVLEP